MLRALRVVSVERGDDPRELALVAFGGAGPLHACALAEELGCHTVLVPAAAGVLSAFGLVVSDERRDTVRSVVAAARRGGRASRGGLRRSSLPRSVVRADRRSGPSSRSDSTGRTRSATATPTARAPSSWSRCAPQRSSRGRRRARRRRSQRSSQGRSSSSSRVRPAGCPTAGRGDGRARHARAGARMIPVELQVIGSALRAVAEEMGAVLIRSAFSSNIKERRDCSTALFDAAGRMIVQAEHIPVHLGAMPEAVAAVLAPRSAARRGLGAQRPVRRRHAPAGHHARLAYCDRVRGQPRAPCGRRRHGAGQPAGRVA